MCFTERPDFAETGLQHRRGNELRDPIAAPHFERLRAKVSEDHHHLAAIVAVDRSRCVEAGDAMLEREAGTGPHLHFIAMRDCQGEAGGDGVPLARRQGDVLGRHDIQPGCMVARPHRQRQTFAVSQALKFDLDHALRFLRAGFFFDGPLAALASISATASSRVTALGSAVLGRVAWVAPSLT